MVEVIEMGDINTPSDVGFQTIDIEDIWGPIDEPRFVWNLAAEKEMLLAVIESVCPWRIDYDHVQKIMKSNALNTGARVPSRSEIFTRLRRLRDGVPCKRKPGKKTLPPLIRPYNGIPVAPGPDDGNAMASSSRDPPAHGRPTRPPPPPPRRCAGKGKTPTKPPKLTRAERHRKAAREKERTFFTERRGPGGSSPCESFDSREVSEPDEYDTQEDEGYVTPW